MTDIKKVSFPAIAQSSVALLIAITLTDALRDTINSRKFTQEHSALARLAAVMIIILVMYVMVTWVGYLDCPNIDPRTSPISAQDNSPSSLR